MINTNTTTNYRKARTKGEAVVLFITLIGLAIATMVTFLENFKLESFASYLLIVALITLFSLFFIRLVQRQFLGNALRVQVGHFSNLKMIVSRIAGQLQMREEPEVFIFQDPTLNAFALGFKRPYTIALHSAIVENLDEEELEAILVHEVGHIWFKHTRVTAFTSPIGSSIPGISYLFGFWSRRAELSSDRLALMVTRNPRALIEGLTKAYVGPKFSEQLDTEGVLFQEHQARGFMNKLAQSLGEHPFMTTRIKELLKLSSEMGLAYIDKNGRAVCMNCGLKSEISVRYCARCGSTLQHVENQVPVPAPQVI